MGVPIPPISPTGPCTALVLRTQPEDNLRRMLAGADPTLVAQFLKITAAASAVRAQRFQNLPPRSETPPIFPRFVPELAGLPPHRRQSVVLKFLERHGISHESLLFRGIDQKELGRVLNFGTDKPHRPGIFAYASSDLIAIPWRLDIDPFGRDYLLLYDRKAFRPARAHEEEDYWYPIDPSQLKSSLLLIIDLRTGEIKDLEARPVRSPFRAEGEESPLLRLTDLATGDSYDFRRQVIHVGRAAGETLPSTTSRRHAEIRQEKGQLFLTSYSEGGGTFVNGDRLNPHVKVKIFPGDVIRFGNDPTLPSYVVSLPELSGTIPSVDLALVIHGVKEELQRRFQKVEERYRASARDFLQRTDMSAALQATLNRIEWEKRVEGLRMFFEPADPFYAAAGYRGEVDRLARSHDGYLYLLSGAGRQGIENEVEMHLKQNGRPIFFIVDHFSAECFVFDPEEEIWGEDIYSHSWPHDWGLAGEYTDIHLTGERISPEELRGALESLTGRPHFPHPLALADLEDLIRPPSTGVRHQPK